MPAHKKRSSSYVKAVKRMHKEAEHENVVGKHYKGSKGRTYVARSKADAPGGLVLKRSSSKRHSSKRKSHKRHSSKRKSHKRRSSKRRSSKRRSHKRRSHKRRTHM